MSGGFSGFGDCLLSDDDLFEIRERCKELRKEKEMLTDTKSESFELIRVLPFPFYTFWHLKGEENMGSWKDKIISSNGEAPGPVNIVSTLVLAENRTKRPDILSKFRKYRGGWDIANKHYWAVKLYSSLQ